MHKNYTSDEIYEKSELKDTQLLFDKLNQRLVKKITNTKILIFELKRFGSNF